MSIVVVRSTLMQSFGQLITGLLLLSTGFAASQKQLSVDEVLLSSSRHYPQIRIALLEINKAHGAFIQANAKFDPLIDANTRSQPAGGYINNYGDSQLTLPTLYNGVKLFAGYRNGRGNWPIYYQNYLTNSVGEYRAGLSLPIFRNRILDKERADLFSTAELMQMKKQDAEAIKIKIYQEAITAYWQWVEAGLQLQAFEQLLILAKTRQEAIEQQAHQGDLPKLAITENMQQIVQRKQLINQGKIAFEQASIHLSLYYRDAKGSPLIPSAKRLPQQIIRKFNIASANRRNLACHPALKRLIHYERMIILQRDLARNDLLPQLDATAYTSKQYGSGGDPKLLPQAALVGFSFKFPLFRREAKGKLIQAKSELLQIAAEKKLTFEQLNNELAKMLVGIRRGYHQVKLLSEELALARKMQQGETKKFYEGDSSLFLVNQREQTTTQVQLNSIQVQVALEELKDKVRFFFSTHTSCFPEHKTICKKSRGIVNRP